MRVVHEKVKMLSISNMHNTLHIFVNLQWNKTKHTKHIIQKSGTGLVSNGTMQYVLWCAYTSYFWFVSSRIFRKHTETILFSLGKNSQKKKKISKKISKKNYAG